MNYSLCSVPRKNHSVKAKKEKSVGNNKKVENWKKGKKKEETFKKVGQMKVVTVMGMRYGSMNNLKQK